MNNLRFFAVLFCLTPICGFSQNSNPKDSIKHTKLDEVLVTGTPKATHSLHIPYSVNIVSEKELALSTKGQLLSTLSACIPNLFITERNVLGFGLSTGGAGGIKIRGVGGEPTNAVLMMVDGQPQFTGLFGHHIADCYRRDYVDHVEVLRGPGALLYGSNAMGGVINVITRKAQADGCNTTMSTQYGSYNTWQTALTNQVRKGRFTSMVSLGFDRTDGVQKGFDFKQGYLYAKVGMDINPHWNIQTDYSLNKFLADDPVYPAVYQGDDNGIYHQNIVRGNASISANNKYKNTGGFVRFYYGYGNHFIRDPKPFHSLDDRFGLTAMQHFCLWQGGTVNAGLDLDAYSGKIPLSGGKDHQEAPNATLHRKHIQEVAPHLSVTQELLKGKLVGNMGIRIAGSNRFDTQWIPQIGLIAHPTQDLTLRGAVGKGFRNPSFKELFLYKMANAELEPEHTANYELAVGKSFGKWINLELTVFLIKGKEMITLDEGKLHNTGHFTNKGIEITAQSSPLTWMNLRANYSFLHTSLDQLTGAPKHQYYLSAELAPHPRWDIGLQLKGAQHLYVAKSLPHEDFVTLGVKAAYQPFKWLRIFAQADNVTDTQYSMIKGYRMPGITAMGGLELKF